MILHSAVLILQSFAAVLTALSYTNLLTNKWQIIFIVQTFVDMIVQLVICYICLTMGSSVQLRKFKMTLDVSHPGAPKVIFTLKESLSDFELIEESIGDISRSSSVTSENSEIQ
jgi:hypothetical protein